MLGHPQKTEAAPYYFTYIDRVTNDDPMAAIENQLPETLQFLTGITEKTSLHRCAPDKWSFRQVLNHITDTERAFAFRALWFAGGFETLLPGYDQNIGAAGADADKITWLARVEEFRHVRLSTISLFKDLPRETWLRTGIADGNPFTVRALAFIIAGHVTHQLALLCGRYF